MSDGKYYIMCHVMPTCYIWFSVYFYSIFFRLQIEKTKDTLLDFRLLCLLDEFHFGAYKCNRDHLLYLARRVCYSCQSTNDNVNDTDVNEHIFSLKFILKVITSIYLQGKICLTLLSVDNRSISFFYMNTITDEPHKYKRIRLSMQKAHPILCMFRIPNSTPNLSMGFYYFLLIES